jgi:Cupin-like domain
MRNDLLVIGVSVAALLYVTPCWVCDDTKSTTTNPMWVSLKWSLAQWIPLISLHEKLTSAAWSDWEQRWDERDGQAALLEMPTIDVSLYPPSELLHILEVQYGADWQRRPLLLKNLWTREELDSPKRRLSTQGLLKADLLEIPYFTNATHNDALSPDAVAPLSAVFYNITQGHPHKIATQFVMEKYPDLIHEVAPPCLTTLFGNYFTPSFPLTTVPLFIAKAATVMTPLHCEPISNIAVQLEGSKSWVIMDSKQWWKLKPSLALDGRAFVKSSLSRLLLPLPQHYTTTTFAGDALYIPTWTWHRVDYNNDVLSVGASLFHFRVDAFVRNNPLFAVLIVPALIKELVGWNTQ